jgi:hypothetical protein
VKLPSFLQGDSPTRLVQGAAAGAVATIFLGFNWGGWVTGGTAENMVRKSTSSAVVLALAPICVENFNRQANAAASLVELKKASAWEQSSFIEKGGWATMPGTTRPDSDVARACAEALSKLQS